MANEDSNRCQAIGWHSLTQCKQRRLKGSEFCSYHDKSPKLPPEERTTLEELISEIIDCREPPQKEVPPKQHITQAEYDASPQDYVIICPGTPRQNFAKRCEATSKRTNLRCNGVACRGQKVCRMHGGKSAGPRSTENCGKHFYKHGKQTREKRLRARQKRTELRILERVIAEHGI